MCFRPPLTDTKAVPLGSIGPIGPDRLPLYVDWNKYGAVTPVQNQGNCGMPFLTLLVSFLH